MISKAGIAIQIFRKDNFYEHCYLVFIKPAYVYDHD